MTYKIRHRLIRWLACGERVDINRPRPQPQPRIWAGNTCFVNGSATSTYKFDGVEWFRV